MPDYGCCMMSRCSGLILGQFLAHFDPIIGAFKAQTLETTKEGDSKEILGRHTKQRRGRRILGLFEGEQAPFGWKHPRACSWRYFEGLFLEEEEHLRKNKIMEKKNGASMPNLFSLFPFPVFFLLMVVITFPLMF